MNIVKAVLVLSTLGLALIEFFTIYGGIPGVIC